ncbi:hypothetical protein NEAUS04_2310 [Nematocida ausubeli]|nr:hypothetical protein NEAUS07_2553 [Nematocida ausubeli]KAI5164579.1 hypothetical protein NEAUS04_2310 [Nematocida ausubeli]
MSTVRNTSNKNTKDDSHQPKKYDNKPSLTTTLSILDYYLQTSLSPPFGHVKNNLVLMLMVANFTRITNKMNLSNEVNLEGLVSRSDKLSAVEINSICQEAGMLAVRNGRYMVSQNDFESEYTRIVEKKNSEHEFYY